MMERYTARLRQLRQVLVTMVLMAMTATATLAQTDGNIHINVLPKSDILPPQVGQYKDNVGKLFMVTVSNNGAEEQYVYFGMQLEYLTDAQGIPMANLKVSTPVDRLTAAPWVIPPGSNTLSEIDLRRLFNHIPTSALQFDADLIGNVGTSDFGLLPEGRYRARLTAYKWDIALVDQATNRITNPIPLTDPTIEGSCEFEVCYRAQAPQLQSPSMAFGMVGEAMGTTVAKLPADNPVFTWSEPVINCNTMQQWRYELIIREVLDNGTSLTMSPQEAIDAPGHPNAIRVPAITQPQYMLNLPMLNRLKEGKVYVAQVTAMPIGGSSNPADFNYSLIENNGKSNFIAFTIDKSNGLVQPTIDDGDEKPLDGDDSFIEDDNSEDEEGEEEEDEEEDDLNLELIGVDYEISEGDAKYVMRNPKIVAPDFSGDPNRAVLAGNTIESKWETPVYVGGEGQKPDTLKIRYRAQIFGLDGYANIAEALEHKPIYDAYVKGPMPKTDKSSEGDKSTTDKKDTGKSDTEKSETKPLPKVGELPEDDMETAVGVLEDYILWKDVAEHVSVGDALLLRILPECINEESVRFFDDESNTVAFTYSDKMSEVFGNACREGVLQENRKPIELADCEMVGKTVYVGEYAMVVKEAKQDKDKHSWSGKGWVNWYPLGKDSQKVKIGAEFKGIYINSDYIVYDGVVTTEQKSNWEHLKDRAKEFSDPSETEDLIPDDIFTEWGLDNLLSSCTPDALQDYVDADAAGEEVNNLAKKVKASKYYDYVQRGYAVYDKLMNGDISTPEIEVFLPLQIPESWNPSPVDIQVVSCEWRPTVAYMNLIGMTTLPDNDITDENILMFGAPRICMDPDQLLPGSGNIILLESLTLNDPKSDFNIKFNAPKNKEKPDDGCMIRWADNKLQMLAVDCEIAIPDLIKCDATTGKPLEGQVPKMQFKAEIQDWEDWISTVSIDPFCHEDLPGWTFTAKDVTLDLSAKKNRDGMTFPAGFKKDHFITPGTKTGEKAWKGLYIGEISVEMPEGFIKNGDSRFKITGSEMLFDKSGVTCKLGLKDPVDASIDDWALRIKEVSLNIMQNDFDGCGMKGDIHVPLTDKEDYIAFSCDMIPQKKSLKKSVSTTSGTADTGDKKGGFDFLLKIQPTEDGKNELDGKLKFDFFLATLKLTNKQTYFLLEAIDQGEDKGYDTKVELCMAGEINIGGKNLNMKEQLDDLPFKIDLPGIHFTQMRISNRKRNVEWEHGEAVRKAAQDDYEAHKGDKKFSLGFVENKTFEFGSADSPIYLDCGNWSVASFDKRIGPFAFGIDDYDFGRGEGDSIHIDVKGRIGFIMSGNTPLVSATTTLRFNALVNIDEKSISYAGCDFRGCSIDIKTMGMEIYGELNVNDGTGDAKNGITDKGYDGKLKFVMPGDFFTIEAEGGYYDHKANEKTAGDEDYAWGFFKATMASKAGIHIDPVVINRIMGGFYFNCQPTKGEDKNDPFGGKPKGKKGPIGIAFGLGMSTTAGEETLKADVDLLVVYDRKAKRLSTFMMNGKLEALAGMIKAKVSLVYEHSTKTPEVAQEGAVENKPSATTNATPSAATAKDDTLDKYLALNITADIGTDTKSLKEQVTGMNSSLEELQKSLNEFQENIDKIDLSNLATNPTSTLSSLSGDDETKAANEQQKASGDGNTDGVEDKNVPKKKGDANEFSAGNTHVALEFKITWYKNGEKYNTPKWHLYVGEPKKDKRCTFTYLKYKSKVCTVDIGADGYLCIGNELPDGGKLPDIPDKIRKFLEGEKKEGVEMGADMAKVEKSRAKAAKALLDPNNLKGGVMVGASVWGDININLGLVWGGIESLAGFDLSLVHYGSTATCVNSGSSMGYDGWYALGQLYAYLGANLGIQIKVGKLINEKVTLINAGIGGVLEMGMPNPTWLEGQLRVKMSFLNGLFKCNKKFKFSAGDHCVPFAGNALADFEMFESVSLGSDSVYEAFTNPELAISRSDANRLVFTTNPSLNSHYRLVDPSYKAYTGNDSTLDIHNSRTYVFDVDKNTDEDGMKMGVRLFDLGDYPTTLATAKRRPSESEFRKQLSKYVDEVYPARKSLLANLADNFYQRENTTVESSWVMESKKLDAGRKRLLDGSKMQNAIAEALNYYSKREVNVSFREDKGTTFHLTNMNLKPGHSYMLVLQGDAYEIQDGKRQWVDYFDESNNNKYVPINWRQTRLWFFRVKSDAEDAVEGDSLKDLTPYVALAYPSVDGTNVQSKGIATTAYMDDILKPTIALNRNLINELPDSCLKWVLTASNASNTVKQERAAVYKQDDDCLNIVADTAFNKVAEFTKGSGKYDFNSETYVLQLQHTFKYEGRDSTVALVDLCLNPAPYDVNLNGKTYTDNWMQSTNSAITGQLLPYSEPFVGASPMEKPVIDYEDYYTGKLASKIDNDETFIDNAEKYEGKPFRLVDPYLYLAYLSKWTFIGDRAINAYSFDEVETPLGSETLAFQKGSMVMNAEFLKNDANVKSLYQVRNDFYSTWNDWSYNNALLPEYPLPITLGSVGGPTSNNQDERATSITPINLNHQKDQALNLANIVESYVDVYNVADRMCRKLRSEAYNLFDVFAWNWVANDFKDIDDDALDKAVKQWSDLHRGQYIQVSSGDVTAKVPYYQLPLIFGDCFGGGAKYKGKSLSRRKRTFNASIGKNDITDKENRWPSEASNLMFFRLIGNDRTFADCEPEAFLRWETQKWHDSYLYYSSSPNAMQIAWDQYDRSEGLKAVKQFKARIYRVDAYHINTGLYTVSGRKLGGGPWLQEVSVDPKSSIAKNLDEMADIIHDNSVYNHTHSDQPMMQALWTADNTTLTLVCSNELNIHETGGKYVTNSYKGEEFDAFMKQAFKEKGQVTRIVIDPSVKNADLRSTHNWFWGCKKLTSIEGLSNINMENVTNMSGMFGNCEQLTTINMSEIVAPKGVNVSMMFYGCKALKTLRIDRFNPMAVEQCAAMFTAVPSTLTTYYSYDLDERIKEQIPGTHKEGSNPVKAIYCTNSKNEKVLLFINTTSEFNINSTYSIKGAKQTYSNMKVLAVWKADQVLKNSNGKWPWRAYYTGIQKVIIDPSFKDSPESTRSWFYEFSNLSSIEGLENLNTSKVTDMRYMFWKNSKLTTLNVKNMNTANVTLMKEMFYGCSGLKELDVTGFDVSQVTDFTNMFRGCSNLERIDISKFRFKNATSLKGLFYQCSALTSISIGSQLDCCDNLTDVSYMFFECTNMKEVSFDAFFNTDKVTTFHSMFAGCENLENINVAGGINATLNTTSATDLAYMFSNCYKLPKMPFSWNGQKVTTTRTMFQNCRSLTELNLSILKTDKVTDMSYMFYGCKGLNLLRLDNLTETSLSATENMFSNVPTACTIYMLYKTWNGKGNIKALLPKATYTNLKLLYPAQVLYVTKGNEEKLVFLSRETPYSTNSVINEGNVEQVWSGMDIYKADGAPVWTDEKGVTKVIIKSSFADVTPFTLKEWFSLPNLKTIEGLQYLNTSQATSMEGMFFECNNLTYLNLSNFDTKNVTDIFSMFYGCRKLTKLDLSSFNTSNVRRMDRMFSNCESLTSLNVSSFDLSKGPNVYEMFRGCSSLTTLDLSSFNTKNIRGFENMFRDCEKLKELDLSNFSTEGITSSAAFMGMFQGCKSLKKLTIGAEFRTRLAHYFEDYPTFGDVRDMEVIAPEKLIPLMHNEFTGVLGFIDGDTGWFRDEGAPRETQDDVPQLIWTEDNNTFTFFYGPQREEGGYFGRHKVTRVWSGTDITATPVKGSTGHFDAPWSSEMSREGSTADKSVNVAFDPTFAKVRPTSTKSWFKKTKPILQGLENLNTAEVTSMARMFEDCDLSGTDLDLSHFNTSKVTDFDRMFNACKAGSINLSSFNTSQAEKLSYMFYGCNVPSLDLSSFNTNRVTNASYWLNSQHIKNLKVGSNFTFNALQPLGPAHWTKVNDMEILVAPASALASVRSAITGKLGFTEGTNGRIYSEENPVAQVIYTASSQTLTFVYKNLYTKGGKYKGQTITELWSGSSVINNQQDKAPWAENSTVKSNATTVVFDASFADAKPTSTKGWFNMLLKLTSFEGMEHLNTSEVTTMARMFYNLKMSTIDVSHFNTAKVTDMSYMFGNAELTKLDLSSINTSNVTTMEGMFHGCQKLRTLNISSFNTSKVTNMATMFYNCHYVELKLSHFNTANVTTMYSMFTGNWKSEITLGKNFVTTKVTDMSYMFSGCKNLTKLDLHTFTGRAATNMSHMFYGCSSLKSFDINGTSTLTSLTTSKVTSMSSMFKNCSSLTSLDLSSFNTDKVTDMGSMFSGCSKLKEIKVGTTFSVAAMSNKQASTFEGITGITIEMNPIVWDRRDAIFVNKLGFKKGNTANDNGWLYKWENWTKYYDPAK